MSVTTPAGAFMQTLEETINKLESAITVPAPSGAGDSGMGMAITDVAAADTAEAEDTAEAADRPETVPGADATDRTDTGMVDAVDREDEPATQEPSEQLPAAQPKTW